MITTTIQHPLRSVFSVFAVVYFGCGTPDSEVPCRDGTSLADDGHCYASNAPTAYDALLALPDCVPVSLDGMINYTTGCVGSACLGMTFEQLNSAFEEYAPCATVSTDYVECTWSIGVIAGFTDDDDNLVPDSDSTNSWFSIVDPAAGASIRGTGVGATPRCAVDELGVPDYVSLHIDGQTTHIRYLAYETVGAYFYDLVDQDGETGSDGVLEEVYLVLR